MRAALWKLKAALLTRGHNRPTFGEELSLIYTLGGQLLGADHDRKQTKV